MSSTTFTPPYPTLDVPVDSAGNAQAVQFEETDVSTQQKRTLGSYISSLTNGKVPGAESGNPDPYNGQIPPNHANPYPIAEPGQPQRSFTSAAAGAVHEAIDLETRPSEIFGDVNEIVSVSPLGQAGSTTIGSGPELFNGVVGAEPGGKSTRVVTPNAKKYATTLGESLGKKNANSGETIVNDQSIAADRSFTSENNTSSIAVDGGIAFGSYGTSSRILLGDSLGKSYDVSNIKRVGREDLFEIGKNLMAKAMGASDGGLAQKKLDAADLRAAAASPALRDFNRTMLQNGQDALESGEPGAGEGRYTARANPSSYGPDDKYTGFDTGRAAFTAFVVTGTFLAAVLAAAALGAAGAPKELPASIPSEVNSGLRNQRRLKSGKFRYEEQPGSLTSGVAKALDIASNLTGLTLNNPIYTPTNPTANYGDCVVAGLASFLGVSYGIDKDIILGSGFFVLNGNTGVLLGEIAVRLATVIFADPAQRQYYMNIIRALNRNARELGSFGEEVTRAGLDLIGAGGATRSIFDSTLFKFVNTLAQIGDLAYTQAAAIELRGTDIETSPSFAYTAESGFNLASADDITKGIAKGFAARRIYGDKIIGRRGTTLGISDLPSAHLIPNGANQSYRSLLAGGVADRMKKVQPSSETGRIDSKTVRSIESVLDAEYMPFYFHDLRTNEIIAFHAFLDDLTDSYSANYNATSGYGRIENVQTYKDTKRSVGCTFHIVGMNPQDFDYMYWQINKLTTMVYPQWSEGRRLTGKVNESDLAFTQPFSQIPTATPVIRLRVGDLIRSNYSRFNLKRLFGYQNNDFGQSVSGLGEGTSSFIVKPGTYYKVDLITGVVKGDTIDLPDGASNASGTVDSTNGVATLTVFTSDGLVSFLTNRDEYTPRVPLNYDKNSDIRDFYNVENNAIVRSFETTAGMGLAAVVTQLGFTWMDGLWGVGGDGPGNRAPRSCKVQMSFEPIHDIAPGLDHEGFNRAPIYPVGQLVNGLVEGGEAEPYGAGTKTRSTDAFDVAKSQIAYAESTKPNILGKLF